MADFFKFTGGIPLANGRLKRDVVVYDYFYPNSNYLLLYINKNTIKELKTPAARMSRNRGWYYPDFRFVSEGEATKPSDRDARSVQKIILPGSGDVVVKNVETGELATYDFLTNFYSTLLTWTDVKNYFAGEDVYADEEDVIFRVYQDKIIAFFLRMFSRGSGYMESVGIGKNYVNLVQHYDGNFYVYDEDFDSTNLYISYDPDVDESKWNFFSTDIGNGCDYESVPYSEVFLALDCAPHYKATDGFEIKDDVGNNLVTVDSTGNITLGYSSVPSASITVNSASGSKVYSFSGVEMTEYYDSSPPSPRYTFNVNPYHYPSGDWNVSYNNYLNEDGYFKSASDNYVMPAKYEEHESIHPNEGDTMQIQSAIDDEPWELSASSDGYTMYMTYIGSDIPEVLEYDEYSDLPASGSSDKLYHTLDDSKYYKWIDSDYSETNDDGTRIIKLCGKVQCGTYGMSQWLFWGWIFEASYGNLTDSKSLTWPMEYNPRLYSYKDTLVEWEPLEPGDELTHNSVLVKYSERGLEEPDIQGNIEFNPDYSSNPYGTGSIITVNYTDFEPVSVFEKMNIIKTIDTSSIVVSGTLYGQTKTKTITPNTLQTGVYNVEYEGQLVFQSGYSQLETTKRDADSQFVITTPKAYSEIIFDGASWIATDFYVNETIDIKTVGGGNYYVLGGLNSDTNEIEELDRLYNPSQYDEGSIAGIVNDYKIETPRIIFHFQNFTCRYSTMFFGDNTTVSVTFEGQEIPESDLEIGAWGGWFMTEIKNLYSGTFDDIYENAIEIMPNGEAVLYVEDDEGNYFVYTKNSRYTSVEEIYFLGNYFAMKQDNTLTFVNTDTWDEAVVEDDILLNNFYGYRYDGKYFYFFNYNDVGVVVDKNFKVKDKVTSDICESIKIDNGFLGAYVYGGTGGCLLFSARADSEWMLGVFKNKKFNLLKKDTENNFTGIWDIVDTTY